MQLALVLMTSESTTRVLGVLGFLLLLPVMIIGVALFGRRVVEKRHAQEIVSEVKGVSYDDDWQQRMTGGGS
jgi:hypothetical protein